MGYPPPEAQNRLGAKTMCGNGSTYENWDLINLQKMVT
jgi:hypothetical protein